MKTISANVEHMSDIPLHKTFRARATASLAAGCLALTLCPAVAFAAQGGQPGQDAQQSGGNPPSGQQQAAPCAGQRQDAQDGPQGDQGGQRDSGSQADRQPSQADGGQPIGQQAPFDGEQQPPMRGDLQVPAGGGQAPDGGGREPGDGGKAPSEERQAPSDGSRASGDEAQRPADDDADNAGDAGEGRQVPGGNDAMPGGRGQAPADRWQGSNAALRRGDAVDDQVRQLLADRYGVNAPLPAADGQEGGEQAIGAVGRPGASVEVPEVPEGEVNVQAVIDSVRDVLRQYDASTLDSADFSDESWLASLTEYVKEAAAQRAESFSGGVARPDVPAPSDGAAPAGDVAAPGDAPSDGAASADGGSPAGGSSPAGDGAAAAGGVDASVLDRIISFLISLFS